MTSPHSDRLAKRLIRILLQYLTIFVEENQHDWNEWIPLFLLVDRT